LVLREKSTVTPALAGKKVRMRGQTRMIPTKVDVTETINH